MKKLCKWKKKRIRKRSAELADMLRRPSHMCTKCARAADDPRRLCKPSRIGDHAPPADSYAS